MSKPYSQLAVAVDIIANEYKTSNPIIISEMIQNDLGLDYTIHQISDYLDINKLEDYEKESNKILNTMV
jgi:hypothetical protein